MPKQHKRDDSQSSYYFINKLEKTNSIRDAKGDTGLVIDELPHGFKAEQFTPKKVNNNRNRPTIPRPNGVPKARPKKKSLWMRLFPSSGGTKKRDIYAGSHKTDPKVYFSAERTYLAWMHTSIILAGIAMAIMSYSDEHDDTAIYGLLLLPVAIIFIVYAMYQCEYTSEKVHLATD
eukprot:scaffold576_cov106-Cylindrotheca_fusiformis.AAC.5